MDKIKLFVEETKLHISNFGIDFDMNELTTLSEEVMLNKHISMDGMVKLAIAFAKAIAIGEVTKEIFEHNLNSLKDFLNSLKENKLKEMFKSNIDPRLFMSEEEIEDKFCSLFSDSLLKTQEVKEKEATETENAISQFTSLFKGLNNEQSFKQFIATKKKSKKSKKKK